MLEIKDLHVQFHTSDHEAVRGIDLTVGDGEIVGLVGESGSGKSVTSMSILRLLADTARIKNGKIEFEGTDLTKVSDKQMREIRGQKIAMVFQDPMSSLNPLIPVGKQVAEMIHVHHPEMKRDELQAATLELFREVRIPEAEKRLKSYPHEFSGGMRQRVMIAMALACKPRLLLADEPTTALDVTIQGQILALLGDLSRERGMGLLLITHDLGVVAEMADEVGVMYAGRIVERAPVRALFAEPRHPYTWGLIRSAPTLDTPPSAKLDAIPGTVPSPGDLPQGCPFRPRCPEAHERCFKTPPVIESAGDDGAREVCCWLAEAR